MPVPRRATVRDLRRRNRAAVLRAVWFAGPLSRQEISGRVAVSPATVGNVVGELLADGLLAEVGQIDSDGGRPAVLVEVVADHAFVLGVDVGETGITVELFDLVLERRGLTQRSFAPANLSPERIATAVAEEIAELLVKACVASEAVLGVGVGAPGIVEQNGTTLVHAPSLGWQAVPLETLLAQAVGLPIRLDNGARALGRAEAWFGAGQGAGELVVCLIGTGVGASLLTDGTVHAGATRSAGEWGHTTLVVDGQPCRCGARGHVEAYVGAEAILARWRRAARRTGAVDLSPEEQLARFADDVRAGHAAAVRTLDEVARYLGAGVADLVNLLNPDRIVIGGWAGLLLGPLLLPLVEREARSRSLQPPFDRVELALCQLGQDAVALGAAIVVVDEFLARGGGAESARSRRPVRRSAARPA